MIAIIRHESSPVEDPSHVSHFALELARKRRRVRERLQRIMAELARERRHLPDAGG